MADDNGTLKPLLGQKLCRQLIVLDAFRDCLVGAADGLPAVVGTHGIVTTPIESKKGIAKRGYVRRKKAGRANIKVHLIAVTIHGSTLDRTIRRIVDPVQGIGWRRNAD